MIIRALKDSVRAEALAARASVPPEQHLAFATALGSLGLAAVQRWTLQASAVVSVFWPIRDEPDTLPLLSALREAGVATALPVTPKRGAPLRFRAWRIGEPLISGRFGTSEPAGTAADLDPDLLFVPLAAFDRRGFRLGYGAGYYDGALDRLRRLKPIRAVGVAFAVQEVGAVPTEPHDQPLDALVTESGLLDFGTH
ncbi:MAG: 5-formyltetrahydrofolate cyclo-ligase [Janthinobacterium lividum]